METILMLNDNDILFDELLLHNEDFPAEYINMEHPNDYSITHEPITEYIYNKKSHHNRLLCRFSWKICDMYVPMTFVCDTGAPMFFYLTKKAKDCIKCRIKEDDLQTEYVELNINGELKKIRISNSPNNHENVNIIGLCLLDLFGLCLSNGSFYFQNSPVFL